ncbi:MAG: hypothetical protein LT102_12745 [Burkholderiaceae bacterium]|nr:hypothetical protein [Burkholderiaceae bacterium]
MKKDDSLFAASASFLCGLIVYISILAATGRIEAWDDGSYYLVGIPFMCFVAFVIGYRFPVMPWRWALWMAAGQAVGALLNGSSLSLLPFAIIFMTIISIPQFIAARFGSRFAIGKTGD